MVNWLQRWVVLCAAAVWLTGCNVGYYAQSVNGHLNLLSAGRPIDALVDDPANPAELTRQLTLAREIREFASTRLALPDNDSYRKYVDTGRDFVTWSVFAAPELSPGVKTWCFPVVGCVPYRGYFSRDAAEAYGAQLRAEGLDVYVGGVPAYSSLGLTSDPLLNTMLRYGETYLAGVIFHELTHQLLYIKDDAAFNEAFAVAVQQSGTELWLRHRGDIEAERRLAASNRHMVDFLELVGRTRDELSQIYAGPGSDAEKRDQKSAAIERLRARYARTKATRWNGYSGYDNWFAEPINNAKLATVSVYNDLEPAFTRLLSLCDGDYPRFYRAVERIGRLDRLARRTALNEADSCG